MSEAHLIKSFKTYADQVCILKDRGMIIDDPQKTETILSTINYYRLSGYWYLELSKQVQRLVMVDFPRALPTQTLTWS